MQHKSKLPDVSTNIFTVMGALANKHNAINLSQGFPNFNSDRKLIDLVSKAMNSGYNQYALMPGILELREAISKKFELLYNTSYHPETEITVTAGATQAIYTIISTFIRPKDEVIVFRPATFGPGSAEMARCTDAPRCLDPAFTFVASTRTVCPTSCDGKATCSASCATFCRIPSWEIDPPVKDLSIRLDRAKDN